ncbi:hypothetical protein K4K49_012914 [Colletotrichum sp. SAR 10_70]|nr:hypothetical protein K4K50_006839 [Colletotrichum sp. SAR 10_71]KAI8166787.1 hypothetical protein KHU50_006672 [Colletotrichum sp. SAR 10_65]KAI8187735.1 hypothetical protein K4K51_008105 [Colletotrichum sp. SAR 10_75]KAI8188056.1 hypothetical protein K4K49_012914 [Colletotrichum sp. SAR 10_70]KAI8208521.1 hypothetical protein K4K52_001240 [Colletotrichum sp. SAR 10_76]KAI8248067.1 hypothetical protein K4K53_001145 [Colletotrichum sp. SAR 10_77]KAJ4996837.1 hypothetical protein K4K48_00779
MPEMCEMIKDTISTQNEEILTNVGAIGKIVCSASNGFEVMSETLLSATKTINIVKDSVTRLNSKADIMAHNVDEFGATSKDMKTVNGKVDEVVKALDSGRLTTLVKEAVASFAEQNAPPEESNSALATKTENAEALQERIAALEDSMKQSNETIKSLESQNADLAKRYADQQEAKKDMFTESLKRIETSVSSMDTHLKEKVARLESEAASLRKELGTKETSLQTLRDEKKQLQTSLFGANNNINTLQQTVQRLQTGFQDEKSQNKTKGHQKNDNLHRQTVETQYEKFQKVVDDSIRRLHQYAKGPSTAGPQKKSQNEGGGSLQTELRESINGPSNHQEAVIDVDELQDKLRQSMDKVAAYETNLDGLRHKLQNAQEKLRKKEENHQDTSKKLNDAQAQLEEEQTKLQETLAKLIEEREKVDAAQQLESLRQSPDSRKRRRTTSPSQDRDFNPVNKCWGYAPKRLLDNLEIFHVYQGNENEGYASYDDVFKKIAPLLGIALSSDNFQEFAEYAEPDSRYCFRAALEDRNGQKADEIADDEPCRVHKDSADCLPVICWHAEQSNQKYFSFPSFT